MSFAANTVLKPISMVTNSCSNLCPSLFTATKISCSNPYASIQLKPLKFPYLFSLKTKEPFYRISVIAAYQENNNLFFLEESEKEERQQIEGDFNLSSFRYNENGENDVELSEEAKVYVGNLSYDVDNEELKHLFGRAGVVKAAKVLEDRETGESRGFGFVTMSTVEEAEKAVKIMHRFEAHGRFLVVNKASPKGSRPEWAPRAPRSIEPSYRIYAGNLSWTVDDSLLERIFSEYGKVVKAQVFKDKATGKSRGFGFVVMSSESEMNDAIDNLDGQDVQGRPIKVNVAEPRHNSSY